ISGGQLKGISNLCNFYPALGIIPLDYRGFYLHISLFKQLEKTESFTRTRIDFYITHSSLLGQANSLSTFDLLLPDNI
ncbi:hypothetical protein MZG88_27790, partial [Escherichia coli]|nr:hypothetical protein [Escherichia coli]